MKSAFLNHLNKQCEALFINPAFHLYPSLNLLTFVMPSIFIDLNDHCFEKFQPYFAHWKRKSFFFSNQREREREREGGLCFRHKKSMIICAKEKLPRHNRNLKQSETFSYNFSHFSFSTKYT